jgi:hypothetical protein
MDKPQPHYDRVKFVTSVAGHLLEPVELVDKHWRRVAALERRGRD